MHAQVDLGGHLVGGGVDHRHLVAGRVVLTRRAREVVGHVDAVAERRVAVGEAGGEPRRRDVAGLGELVALHAEAVHHVLAAAGSPGVSAVGGEGDAEEDRLAAHAVEAHRAGAGALGQVEQVGALEARSAAGCAQGQAAVGRESRAERALHTADAGRHEYLVARGVHGPARGRVHDRACRRGREQKGDRRGHESRPFSQREQPSWNTIRPRSCAHQTTAAGTSSTIRQSTLAAISFCACSLSGHHPST